MSVIQLQQVVLKCDAGLLDGRKMPGLIGSFVFICWFYIDNLQNDNLCRTMKRDMFLILHVHPFAVASSIGTYEISYVYAIFCVYTYLYF